MRKLRQDEIERRWQNNRSKSRHPVAVLVEDVRSAYNVGSIFRTADAGGLEKVIVCGISPTPENRRVHKTALGSQDTVPWEYAKSAPAALVRLKEEGYRIAALEITDEPTFVKDLGASDFPLCLVVGHELNGVSDEVLRECDLAIELPQFGDKHSLNAAVAFGIAAATIIDRYRLLLTVSTGVEAGRPEIRQRGFENEKHQ